MNDEIINDARHAFEMLRHGDITNAIRVSGEALARADSRWRQSINAKSDTSETELNTLLQTGYTHSESLIAAGEWREAYSLALILLYCTAIDKSRTMSIDRGCLVLWLRTLDSLNELTSNMPKDDLVITEHVTTIISYIVSMVYVVYNRLLKANDVNPVMVDAFETLRQYSFAVKTPFIDVAGDRVDPIIDFLPIMADLIGRSRALGIFNVETEI